MAILTEPDQIARFRAATIRTAIKLYWKTGIRVNRAYTPTAMHRTAEEITGLKFRRGDWPSMIEALERVIAE